jgi:hypothetical protein
MLETVYLAGAINGCTDEQCKDWREYVKSSLEGLYNCLDPMRRDYRGKELESVNEIVEGDYQDINESDIILANANDPSWGTAMEIHEAWTKTGAEVFLICNKEKPSPWLIYHSDKIFKTLYDALDHLHERVGAVYEN